MKIALLQLNPVIGDFRRNTDKILHWLDKARMAGCRLAILPELALCGYPPQDLLDRPAFLAAHDRALAALSRRVSGITVLLGALQRHTGPTGKPLHNSCAVIEEGEARFAAQKRLLPTYDVFDEGRYFEPGEASRTVTVDGRVISLTICEDIWNDKDVAGHPLYGIDPVAEIMAGGRQRPELLVNIAASPYCLGKIDTRLAIFTTLTRKYRVPLLYCNQVGGQDSLVFDGASLAMDATGTVVASGSKFREDMVVVEWDGERLTGTLAAEPLQPATEADETAEISWALVCGCRDYIAKCGFSRVLLGLSGGIDSAVAATLAARAVGAKNVLGVAMPAPVSSPDSLNDARRLAANLGIDFLELPIADIFAAMQKTLAPAFAGLPADVTEQNLQARIRGVLLMALSNKFGRLLISTGNKSEMAVGYCTLYGDMSGGLAILADVPKLMVYRLAHHLNREGEVIPASTIRRPPSAELAPDQKDEDDLPPYEVLDPILTMYLEENRTIDEITAAGFPRETVADVIRRIRNNEYKRKQAPLGIKVTSKAFGFGRRYPTAVRFREEEEG